MPVGLHRNSYTNTCIEMVHIHIAIVCVTQDKMDVN